MSKPPLDEVDKRPPGCSCYRANLRHGTASPHCNYCPWHGYQVAIEDADTRQVKKIAGFRNLPGWDGEPISEETIQLAFRMADVLGADARIVPVADGSIQFELDRPWGVTEEIIVRAVKP